MKKKKWCLLSPLHTFFINHTNVCGTAEPISSLLRDCTFMGYWKWSFSLLKEVEFHIWWKFDKEIQKLQHRVKKKKQKRELVALGATAMLECRIGPVQNSLMRETNHLIPEPVFIFSSSQVFHLCSQSPPQEGSLGTSTGYYPLYSVTGLLQFLLLLHSQHCNAGQIPIFHDLSRRKKGFLRTTPDCCCSWNRLISHFHVRAEKRMLQRTETYIWKNIN